MAYGAIGLGDVTEAFVLGCSCLIGIEQFNMALSHMAVATSIQYGLFLFSMVLAFLYMLICSRYSEFYRNGSHALYTTLCLAMYLMLRLDISMRKMTFLLSVSLGVILGILIIHSSCYYSRHKSPLLAFCTGLFTARLLPSMCWCIAENRGGNFDTHLWNASMVLAKLRFILSTTSLILKLCMGKFEVWNDGVDDERFYELITGGSRRLKASKIDGRGLFLNVHSPMPTIKCLASLMRPVTEPVFSLLASILLFLGYSPIFGTVRFHYAQHLLSSLSKSEMVAHIVGCCFGAICPLPRSNHLMATASIFVLHLVSAGLMFWFHQMFCIYGLFCIVILPAFLLGYTFSYSLGLMVDVSLRQNCYIEDPAKRCCGDERSDECFCKDDGSNGCINGLDEAAQNCKDVIIWFGSGEGACIKCTCDEKYCQCFCCNNVCCCKNPSPKAPCGCRCCLSGCQCCKNDKCKAEDCKCECSKTCKKAPEPKCDCCSNGKGCKDRCLKCMCCGFCAKPNCGSGTGEQSHSCDNHPAPCNKCHCCKNITLVSNAYHFLLSTTQTNACNDCQLTVRLEATWNCLCCINGTCKIGCKNALPCTKEGFKPVNVHIGSLAAKCPICSIRKVSTPDTFVYGDGLTVTNEFDIREIVCHGCCHSDLTVDLRCVLRNTFFRVSPVNYPNKFLDAYTIFFTYSSYEHCPQNGPSKHCGSAPSEPSSEPSHKPISKLFLSRDDHSNGWPAVTANACNYVCPRDTFGHRYIQTIVSDKSSFYAKVDKYRFLLTLVIWMAVTFLVSLIFIEWIILKSMRTSYTISTETRFEDLRKEYMKPESWHAEVLDRLQQRKTLIGGTSDIAAFAGTFKDILSSSDCNACLAWAQSVAKVENKDLNAVTWSILTGIYHSYFILKFFSFQSFFIYWEDAWRIEYNYFCKNFTQRMDRIMLRSKCALNQLHDGKISHNMYTGIQQTRVSTWEVALKEMRGFSNLYDSELEPWELPLELYERLEYYLKRWNTRFPHLVSWCNSNTNIFDWTAFFYGFSIINEWYTKFKPWIMQTSSCAQMSEDELERVSAQLNRVVIDELQIARYKFL